MRRTVSLLVALAALTACSSFQRKIGLKDDAPAHVSPKTTSIYGTWVLETPDSTAFAGASNVVLELNASDFIIRADYPTQGQVVVRGTARLAPESGLLTFTPTEVDSRVGQRGSMAMAKGQPYTLLATAAGNTLIFASPNAAAAVPSSVWHAEDAAQAAGKTPAANSADGKTGATKP